jgi:hypothetical protein
MNELLGFLVGVLNQLGITSPTTTAVSILAIVQDEAHSYAMEKAWDVNADNRYIAKLQSGKYQSNFDNYVARKIKEMVKELTEYSGRVQTTKDGKKSVKTWEYITYSYIDPVSGEIETALEYIGEQSFTESEALDHISTKDGTDWRTTGYIHGMTQTHEVSPDDFEGHEIVMDFDGLVETIQEDRYWEARAYWRGNDAIREAKSQEEIKYGTSWIGGRTDWSEMLKNQIEEELKWQETNENLDFRSWSEMKFWAMEVQKKLETATTMRELFHAGRGALWPSIFAIGPSPWIKTESKTVTVEESKWFIPLNGISKDDRARLLALYHSKKKELLEKRNMVDVKMGELHKQIISEMDDPRASDAMIVSKVIKSKADACALMSAASRGVIPRLPYGIFKEIRKIVYPDWKAKEKVVSEQQLTAMAKFQECIKSNSLNKLTKEEAKDVLAYARSSNERRIDKKVYFELVKIAS